MSRSRWFQFVCGAFCVYDLYRMVVHANAGRAWMAVVFALAAAVMFAYAWRDQRDV